RTPVSWNKTSVGRGPAEGRWWRLGPASGAGLHAGTRSVHRPAIGRKGFPVSPDGRLLARLSCPARTAGTSSYASRRLPTTARWLCSRISTAISGISSSLPPGPDPPLLIRPLEAARLRSMFCFPSRTCRQQVHDSRSFVRVPQRQAERAHAGRRLLAVARRG